MRFAAFKCFLVLGAGCFFAFPRPSRADESASEVVKFLRAPPGFSISVYAARVPNARELALAPNGSVFVGSLKQGAVYALVPNADRSRAADVVKIASGLDLPNGVAFRGGALYVSEPSRILKYDQILTHLKAPPKPSVVYDKLPTEHAHGWKFIAFGPDGKLYVPIGAPCNICRLTGIFGSIYRMNADGSDFELVATGIRNSVGFDWKPDTKALWFTDNGRDELGDNLPPDELNTVTKLGQNFGYPYCHAGTIKDPQFGNEHACSEFQGPAAALDPHGAALGMRFYEGSRSPSEYKGNIFIAQHGSWNRSHKIGYRVLRVVLKGGRVQKVEPFIEGWLGAGEKVHGRPVDVQLLPDGTLLISDDEVGAVYRVSYSASRKK
jgi:glucose/arabinose dehydrogenase